MSVVGQGNAVFVGLSSGFSAESGFGIDGKKVPAVNSTVASAANMTKKAGNLPDYGQVTGTLFIDTTAVSELDALIGTTASLTYTFASEGGTAATVTGAAILLEASLTTTANGMLEAAAIFEWDGIVPPAYVDEV